METYQLFRRPRARTFVSIESKRNGNQDVAEDQCLLFIGFQSNLRGMETAKKSKINHDHTSVSIESKRNGNTRTAPQARAVKGVSIESKRNGNL